MIQKKSKKKALRKWHLATNEDENSIISFEWTLLRLMTAFNRYNENAFLSISGHSLSASEITLLNVIRMHETPKSAAVLAALLNRDDYSNIQYGLKKLRELRLIRVHSKSKPKQYTYELTVKGVSITDKFVDFRREHVVNPIQAIHNWQDGFDNSVMMNRLLTGIFEEAARDSLTYIDDDTSN